MKLSTVATVLLVLTLLPISSATVLGQVCPPAMVSERSYEATVVETSAEVLNEIMAVPAQGIPRALLADAQAIAIVPGLVKGGFIIGVRHGRGVVVVRDEQNGWKPPLFVSITGGSIGWQIGIQATDVVLVFKTKKSVEGLLRGQFTIGANVSAAAGPVGREASAATDAALQAEIFSYARSRGLFAGLALDGSAVEIDSAAGMRYYQVAATAPGQVQPLPPSAEKLLREVARCTSTAAGPITDMRSLQRQLADSSQRLSALLDDNWKRYLALPTEVYATDRQPAAEALSPALVKFNAVADNPQYQSLCQRPEFQQTLSLLRQYASLLPAQARLPLPPPPR